MSLVDRGDLRLIKYGFKARFIKTFQVQDAYSHASSKA